MATILNTALTNALAPLQATSSAASSTGQTGITPFAPSASLPSAGAYPISTYTPPTIPASMTMGGAMAMTPTNPMEQAALAQRGALARTTTAGEIGTSNLSPYLNPYTQNVLGNLALETGRAMDIGANQLGAQATRAGAFGGSRHGIAQGQMMGDLARGYQQQAANLQQQNFLNAQQMAQQDIQNRMSQAAQLGALGQQSFGYGQGIQQGLSAQGQMQQTMLQALIDAAKGQFAGYAGAPATSLGYMGSALGSSPTPTSTTQTGATGQSQSNSLLDIIGTGAQIYSMWPTSDVRLKESIKKVGELANGIGVYTWKWTKQAIESGKSNNMLKGVLAQEVRKILPEAVAVGTDGYMRVNYSHPELKGAI